MGDIARGLVNKLSPAKNKILKVWQGRLRSKRQSDEINGVFHALQNKICTYLLSVRCWFRIFQDLDAVLNDAGIYQTVEGDGVVLREGGHQGFQGLQVGHQLLRLPGQLRDMQLTAV